MIEPDGRSTEMFRFRVEKKFLEDVRSLLVGRYADTTAPDMFVILARMGYDRMKLEQSLLTSISVEELNDLAKALVKKQ